MKRTRDIFMLCIVNQGYPASLDIRKLYRVLPDAAAEKLGRLRVIDESGEDYLYPKSYFAPVAISKSVQRILKAVG